MAIGLLGRKSKDISRNREINRVVLVPVEEIKSNPNQPRREFDEEGIRDLAASIEENGLLQPVTLRKIADDSYELIAGERRTIAYRRLGEKAIPAIIEEYSEGQSAVFALIENLQRKDLNYFEEALGISRLMNERGLTQQQVSERLGKAQSTVANKLRLLKYSYEAQRLMIEMGLTERHARAFLPLADTPDLFDAVKYTYDKNLTVEQTEEYVAGILSKKPNKQNQARIFVVKDMRIFTNTINKAVSMLNLAGIKAVSKRHETEKSVEIIISIPKSQDREEQATGPVKGL